MNIHNTNNAIPFILSLLIFQGCTHNNASSSSTYAIPSMNHDLGYIPYDSKVDLASYLVCDSNRIYSGRNRLQYVGGKNKFIQEIESNFLFKEEYETFSGYVVIRFIHNCEGKSGRYRAQSLNLDFSPLNAPSGLMEHSIHLVKSFDQWTKSSDYNESTEYSKYINLKFDHGTIQHVLL